MIKDKTYRVCMFYGNDAQELVLAMPTGGQKESLAGPVSRYEECERFLHLMDIDNKITYYFLLIINSGSRLLLASDNLEHLSSFVEDTNALGDEVSIRCLKLISSYLTSRIKW